MTEMGLSVPDSFGASAAQRFIAVLLTWQLAGRWLHWFMICTQFYTLILNSLGTIYRRLK